MASLSSNKCKLWNGAGPRLFHPPADRNFLGALSVLATVRLRREYRWESAMNGIIYLVGLVVVVLAILSFLGLR
jgi:hypothetical protein